MEANQSPRQAEASDSDAIAALHVKSWRATYRGILPDIYLDNEAEEERRNYWRHHLNRPHPDDLVLLFQDGDRLLGFISIIPAPDHDVDALIENLHVDAGGIASMRLSELPYTKIPRPIWPLDH